MNKDVQAVVTVAGHRHLEGLILKDGEDVHFERDFDGPLMCEKNGHDGTCDNADKPAVPAGLEKQVGLRGKRALEGYSTTSEVPGVEKWNECFHGDETLHVATFGMAVASKVYEKLGSFEATIAYVESLVQQNNLIYANQVGVRLEVDQLNIQKTSGEVAWDRQCEKQGIHAQLDQFRAWVQQEGSTSSMYQLLDDCYGTSGSTIGLAYISTFCGYGGWDKYGFNTGVTYLGFNTWKTLAHEIGHTFGAGHSFEEGQGKTGGIMDYGNGKYQGMYQFNTKYRKDEVCKVLADAKARNCAYLSPAVDAVLTASPTTSPTTSQTLSPTKSPSKASTPIPTAPPTNTPTMSPSKAPTDAPTKTPTMSPSTPTNVPTKTPTNSPTMAPTTLPTDAPTKAPTNSPTMAPTTLPTDAPNKKSTNKFTNDGTYDIAYGCTNKSTNKITNDGTYDIAYGCTNKNTNKITNDGTYDMPTDAPTKTPTKSPTMVPTTLPTTLSTPSLPINQLNHLLRIQTLAL